MAYEDGIEFVPDGASQQCAREAWIAAVRAIFAGSRAELSANHRAQIDHEFVCDCGRKYSVVFTMTVGDHLHNSDNTVRLQRVDFVDRHDACLDGAGDDVQLGLQTQDAVFNVVHGSLHQVGCTSDGRGRAGAGEGDKSPRARAIVRGGRAVLRWLAAQDDSVIQYALGAISLFLLLAVFLVAPILAGWQ